MAVSIDGVAPQARPRTMANRLTRLRETRNWRRATDYEHARDIRDAGGDKSMPRRDHPMSIKEIAAYVGVTSTYIGNLFDGASDNPTVDVVARLAQLYDVSIDDLVREDSELDLLIDTESARQQVQADSSLRTMADRLNELITAIHPGGGDSEYDDEQLAQIAGCTVAQIRGLRDGSLTDTISLGPLKRLAQDAFGVTVGYLVDGVDAERFEQRVEWLRQHQQDGALALAMDLLNVNQPDHQHTLAQMARAFFQVEARPPHAG
jgi:transcriptional regulator with XRE-family HTH domain